MPRMSESLIVGQEVVIKTVAEMVDEGLPFDKYGGISHARCYFNPLMSVFSGRKATLVSLVDNGGYIEAKLSIPTGGWHIASYMIKPFVSKYPSNYGKVKYGASIQAR